MQGFDNQVKIEGFLFKSVMLKSHKIRLNPTKEQEAYFWQAAGVARFCFNWGLAEYNKRLDAKEKVSGRMLKKEFNAIKAEQFPWVSEVSTWAYQGAFDDLQKAFSNFFDKKKKGLLKTPRDWKPRKDGKPFGWPTFKRKFKSKPTFYQANIAVQFDDHLVRLPKSGWVNMAEPLRFEGKVMSSRVSYYANHWWISVLVEVDHELGNHNGDVVGIDLGIKYLAVTSDGVIYDNPKAFYRMQRKLRRLQRSFSRMEKQSSNWHKMKKKIAKLHFRIASIRNEASHQMTTELARDYGIIGVEDLNVKGMVKNKRLAKAVSDAAMSEKRRQLSYKADWNGGTTVAVDRWFPSSKTCNKCGWLNVTLKLSDRKWTCGDCGEVIERDDNAAKNIRDEAIRILSS